ncbi:Slp/YeaY family lipoprotein [Xylella taiwanensis]|uniref:Membrane protein n=1 Tax=Xylella taiwanensis TaxID=1444770 RepID=Z9JJT2_9GAMM|nr:Slp/YeaY family lipoprotein [Xylella taiwanensis]AXI83493.1 membrane protein [Xylella taiwanensis]EWS78002.1 membrane protein [Xylella taiwanensis]MCD8456569.1 Slp/YeaY family lipoprotein [Xylella taiwanensis]MCD8458976.1 Slp/YeaY family lipoprotein [Xylella taiwanensis]MCD8461115.1 Slp/YeaY family lipoprotein [Xylella taiwanensis]
MRTRLLVPLITLLALAACVTVPKPLQGQFSTITPRDSVTNAQIGTLVRWGGKIIKTIPTHGQTCFEMMSRQLSPSGRPDSDTGDANDGRFIACRNGFYDPAVFEPGREVTFIGKIESYENTRIGEYDYRLPKVAADVIYLWPVIREIEVVPVYPYGPWGPMGPWGWGHPRWWW